LLKPAPRSAVQEALIASFEAEGWSRKDAVFKAARFRQAFVPGTSDAEIARSREVCAARNKALKAEAQAQADAQWEAAAPCRKAVA
jgi:hypothetical protein